MATQAFGVRGLRSAVAAGLGMAAGALVAMAAHRQAVASLCVRLEHVERAARAQQHTNLANQQRMHWELLSKAMDDSQLAEVLDLYEVPVSPKQRRQYIFANALYTNLLFYYRIGNLSRDEFFKHARGIFQSPIVREYWYSTRQQRASISDTDEAELGLMVDELLRQMEEADTEEWWVIGEPPDA
ncbi:DUF6082 family protein [Streptomyces sp. NPDC006602]|uniref:DUF6082 family protein n=1 Tax=Streptomyces sp. NPDC006602 TaxID=3364751 RepID=UPI00368CA436